MRIVLDKTPMWINYHHLYCFYAIATEGGPTLAAKKLGIGPSALSIQMKQFEQAIGFPLFERAHKRLTVNERGRVLLAYAKEIFRLGVEMIETVYDQPTAKLSHLQIGVLDTIPKHLTVNLVKFALQKKSCTVSILEGKLPELTRDLTEHRIDLILTNHLPMTSPGQIYSRRIAQLPLWVVGGKSFVKLKQGFPKSLHQKPFIVPTGDSRVRHEFENFCKESNITPRHIAEAQDVMVQKLLAIEELGLTVIPEFAVKEYLKKKELYLIGQVPKLYEEISLVSASRKLENPVASLLMQDFRLG